MVSITQLALTGFGFGLACGAAVLGLMASYSSVTRSLGEV